MINIQKRSPDICIQFKGILISSITFLIMFCYHVDASAATIYIPPVKAIKGQSIDIPIIIDETENLAGIKIIVEYDLAVFEFKKSQKTDLTSSLMHVVNDKKPGLLIIVMAGAKGIKGKDIPLLILTFEIKKNIKTPLFTSLEITETQLMSDQLKDIKCTTKVGQIEITP